MVSKVEGDIIVQLPEKTKQNLCFGYVQKKCSVSNYRGREESRPRVVVGVLER